MKSEMEEYKKKKKTKVFIETLMNYNIEADRSIIDFDYYKMKFDNVLDGLDKSEYYVQIPLEKKNELFEISNYNVILRNVDEIIKSENQILFLGQEWEMGFLNVRIKKFNDLWKYVKDTCCDCWLFTDSSFKTGVSMWRYEYYHRIYFW